jgi:hypothetical protein
MDRGHEALRGDEVRACWQALPGAPEPLGGLFAGLGPPAVAIVPVETGESTATHAAARSWSVPRADRGADGPAQVEPPDLSPMPASSPTELHDTPARSAMSHPSHPGVTGVRRFLPVAGRPMGRDREATDAGPVGRLVDAPLVAPTGRIGSVADQLRRAERYRTAAGSLDAERLGGPDGIEPAP